jgi:hypothetical protein
VVLSAVWVVAAAVTPRPVNPVVPVEKRLGARSSVPAEVDAILRTSCLDCHSNETRWPWYATLFPASVLLKRDVAAARGQMNFSEWEGYNVFDRADSFGNVPHATSRSSSW